MITAMRALPRLSAIAIVAVLSGCAVRHSEVAHLSDAGGSSSDSLLEDVVERELSRHCFGDVSVKDLTTTQP